MKHFKFLAFLLLLSWVSVACNKVEKILPSHDGLWQLKSAHNLFYENDVVTDDTTYTEGLGQMQFAEDGTGFRLDAAGKRYQDYTWLVNDDNTVLTITDTAGVPIDNQIVAHTRTSMTLFSRLTTGTAPTVYTVEATAVLELVK